MSPRILSVSYDRGLLLKRQMSLENAGFEVVSAEGAAEALEHQSGDFDLIILGHTIPHHEKRAIATAFLKAGSHTPVLSLLRRGDPPIPEATRVIEPSPTLVLETVRSMFAR